ncbi:alpha/beta hydrolase family protein [uncultured Lactobacillus sp.]|uniref:alpha/beta hydrolase n=1 Tax=uncultured Lactobacillus sp. TaxID=153152 RepID=UPI00260FF7ED|nr:alpha/beta fold hydrolase [uncultured Lactobacillus sp.]
MLNTSKIITSSFYSPSLKLDWNYAVYLPTDFDPTINHSLLLMLHGIYGNYTNFIDDNRINSQPILDSLEEKYHKQAIVVFVDGFNSFYINSVFCQKMQDAIMLDLLPYLKSKFKFEYPISIGGISMGGFGSARLSLQFPNKFKRVILLSPAVWQDKFYQPIFKTIHCFGDDKSNWNISTYRQLFPTTYLNQNNRKLEFFVRTSKYDQVVDINDVSKFVRSLTANYNNVKFKIDTFGRHNWNYWKQIITPAYEWFYEQN